jgi:CubicO group peptidase (beta-lactamase class C family)
VNTVRFKRYTLFLGLFLQITLVGNAFAGQPEANVNNEEIKTNTPDFITQETADQINAYYLRRHKFDGFNGCVLVAKEGKPIYSGAFGYGNYAVKDTLTTQSSFQLASVTKTFTSAAILKLVDEGKISLEDTLQKFFPDFPYRGITVRLLLSHRSGLPEYIYWTQDFIGKDVPFLTNQSLMDLLISKKPPIRTLPDRIFLYTNTNFAVLALIIEKVSGETYKHYMEDNIFTPLGMTNTFVCSIEDSASHCGAVCYQARRWTEWKTAFSDGVVGDKGIYSSVEDMLIWDNALKEGKVLSEQSLQEAYSPQSHDRYSFAKDRSRNYGLGWRMIKQKDGSSLIYHNGNWHGCNNVFARNLKNGYTIIVLGNKENEANYMTQPVWDIITRMKNMENVAASTQE